MFYSDNSIYEGNFKDDMKEGEGKFVLESGNFYIGEFHRDQINGKGCYKWSETKLYDGEWKDNTLNGLGVYKNGDKLYKGIHFYLGYFKHGKKHGKGVTYFINGSVLVSRFVEDSIEGAALLIDKKGKEQMWEFAHNKMIKKLEILHSDYKGYKDLLAKMNAMNSQFIESS